MNNMKQIYIGTYTDKNAKGIYKTYFDNGKFYDVSLFCEIDSPKYLAKYEDYIVALCDKDNKAGIALIDKDGNIVDSITYEDKTSCFVCVDNGIIYTANYHEGSFSALKNTDKLELIKNIKIKDKCGCHQVLIHNDMIMVPCLFLDKVMLYDKDFNNIGFIELPVGSGPRHGVFSKDHKYLYLVSELSNELFKIDMNSLKIIDSILLLDNKKNLEGTAAIRMSENEKYLYVSTRGEDVISVVDIQNNMKLAQANSCFGGHPRDFIIVDDYLICANRFSNEIVSIKLNDNLIVGVTDKIEIPDGVALISY